MLGLKNSQPKILLLPFLALVAVVASASAQVATNWVAFNDHRMPPGPGPTTHSNTTVYSMLGYPAATGGPLKDHFTAATLSAVLRVISTGGDGPDDFGACQDPNVGTPAYNLFNGIVDVGGPDDNGIVGLRNSEMNVSTITFTNLDPSQRYVFRGTSVRGNNYNDRWAIYEIQGAVSFVNAHVDGSANLNLLTQTSFPAAGLTASQVALNSGENRAGSLIGWDEVDPGEDGSFSIVQRQYVGPAPFGNPAGGPYGYGMNAIMLAEVGEPVPVSITRQPEGQTLFECRSFALSVGVSGSFPRSFQWIKDGVEIPGATTATYSVALAQTSDSGTYTVRVTNPLNTVTSDPAVVTVNEDTAPPIALGASSVHPLEIGIQFNELMESNTTTSTFGYTVNGGPGAGGPSVTNVILRPNGTSVILQLDSPVTSPFTVSLTEAYDCAGNIIDPSTSLTGSRWADSGDIGLPALVGNAFSHEPGDVEIAAGGADIWGTADQFHYVHNFRTGDFDVKVKVARLDPTHASAKAGLMARETLDGPSATIWAITMSDRPPGRRVYEAGRRTTAAGPTASWGSGPPSGLPNAWIRLRRNGDIFRAYHGTNGTDWLPLAGPVTQLLPPGVSVGLAATSHNVNQHTLAVFRDFGDFTYPGATLAINPQPASQTVQTHQSVTFTSGAVASGAPANEIFYQWQRSPDGATWTNIPGATSTNFTIAFPAGEDDGDSFRLVASIPGATATSDAATLTLTPDTVRPTVRAVIGVSPTKVVVLFSEPMGASTADPFNYQIDQGIGVIDAMFDTNNPRRIDLTLDPTMPLTVGATYTLSTTATDDGMGGFIGAIDPSGNPINPNPTTTMFVAQNYPGDPNTLRELPTNARRALGSLTLRGFDGRMVQIAATIANDNSVAEQMLAGSYINPATGMPYPNLAPLPRFVETNTINYGDNPAGLGTGRLRPDRAFPGYTAPADNMAMEILTYLELRGGIYRMGVNSDDGFRVTPATSVSDANNSIVLAQFNGGRAPADTPFDFIVTEDGLYPFRLIWQEGQGGAACEWWIQSLVNSSYIAINSDSIKAFRNVIVAPRLTATRGNGTITLSWTDPEGAYQLQSALYLEEPAWSNVSGVTANGNDRSITINTANYPTEFFRLRKP